MEDSKKKKEAEMMKKFEALKKEHQQKFSGESFIEDSDKQQGVLPERSLKKNLGCGG